MPHAVLKLAPSANTTETPALNEGGGIAGCNLIRFQPDPAGGTALTQKLGGWQKFYASALPAVARALCAWEDLNDNSWLAFGTQTYGSPTRSQLGVIKSGALTDITPVQANSSITPPPATATVGSAAITITDTVVTGITNTCSVYIPTHIAVGGIVLFGLYACDPDGSTGTNTYTVYARTLLGALNPAINTNAAALPQFTSTDSSNVVKVTLPNHGYSVGLTFPVLVSTAVGGLTLYGNYVVQSVVDADNFTINALKAATSTATVVLNGGNAIFIYNGLGTTPSAAANIASADWTMDNFGGDLVACPCPDTSSGSPQTTASIPYQPVYLWTPGQQPTAAVIPQAPPVNDGVFVAMPQRQLVTWGSTATGIQDPLLINWCDVNNPYQWIPLVTNQAGSYRIPKGSRIVRCVQGPQQALVWTDVDVWSMQYTGPPYVYSFNEIGTGCGLIARKAAICFNGFFFWMGFEQFFMLSYLGVQPLPCPVWDVVYQNLDQSAAAQAKIRVAANSRFWEITWYYPSASGSGEVDSYVKYNVALGVWDYGSLGRTAWVDQSVLGAPIGADPTTLYLYQHETSNDADGAAMSPYLQTGYVALAEADFKAFVDLVWPDMRWGMWDGGDALPGPSGATVQISFYVVDYPGQTPTVYGPYPVTQATTFFNTRLRGRLVSVRVGSSDLGTWWRIGAIRYRYAPDGKF